MGFNFVTDAITYISYTDINYPRKAALKFYVSVP